MAPSLPYEANIEFVARAVELAHRAGAAVEAELGSITGDEDVALAVEAGALTDPDQAVEFVARTRADCLAVSIGNVHGIYRQKPQLDFERLEAIRGRVLDAAVPARRFRSARRTGRTCDRAGGREDQRQHRAPRGLSRGDGPGDRAAALGQPARRPSRGPGCRASSGSWSRSCGRSRQGRGRAPDDPSPRPRRGPRRRHRGRRSRISVTASG